MEPIQIREFLLEETGRGFALYVRLQGGYRMVARGLRPFRMSRG